MYLSNVSFIIYKPSRDMCHYFIIPKILHQNIIIELIGIKLEHLFKVCDLGSLVISHLAQTILSLNKKHIFNIKVIIQNTNKCLKKYSIVVK